MRYTNIIVKLGEQQIVLSLRKVRNNTSSKKTRNCEILKYFLSIFDLSLTTYTLYYRENQLMKKLI